MTVARGAAIAALVLGGVLVGLLLFGGGSQSSTYTMRFQNAGQLVKDDDVQIGGRRIGSIRDIRLTDDNQADIEISVQERYAPLREGTRGVIRATSLSGIANRYIALAPGQGREMDEGALIASANTTDIVDLDQLFNTLDPEARKGLQDIVRGSATSLEGKGAQSNEAARYFNPTLSTTRRLVNEVNRDSGTLQRFLVDGARAMTALSEKRETLTDLVSNSNGAAQGIVAENQAFSDTLQGLPPTLRRTNSTFVNLRATLEDLDVLVAESKPATRELAPFLRELRPLVTDARPTIRDLRLAIRQPGADNDLVELTRKQPALARAARPALRNTTQALRRSTPVLDFVRPYTTELVGWFRDFGQGAGNYDANGHYARIQPIFNTFSFTDNAAGGALVPKGPDRRLDGLEFGFLRRCPGGSTQPTPDGSSPFTDDGDLDCDQRQSLSGP